METESRTGLLEQGKQASARERTLWDKARGKHPGQPGHDPATWAEWLDAAAQVRTLAEQARRAPRPD